LEIDIVKKRLKTRSRSIKINDQHCIAFNYFIDYLICFSNAAQGLSSPLRMDSVSVSERQQFICEFEYSHQRNGKNNFSIAHILLKDDNSKQPPSDRFPHPQATQIPISGPLYKAELGQ